VCFSVLVDIPETSTPHPHK